MTHKLSFQEAMQILTRRKNKTDPNPSLPAAPCLEQSREDYTQLEAFFADVSNLITEVRPYLESTRLREQANAIDGIIDRMPVRELCKRIEELGCGQKTQRDQSQT